MGMNNMAWRNLSQSVDSIAKFELEKRSIQRGFLFETTHSTAPLPYSIDFNEELSEA